jgi:hypothetical protein
MLGSSNRNDRRAFSPLSPRTPMATIWDSVSGQTDRRRDRHLHIPSWLRALHYPRAVCFAKRAPPPLQARQGNPSRSPFSWPANRVGTTSPFILRFRSVPSDRTCPTLHSCDCFHGSPFRCVNRSPVSTSASRHTRQIEPFRPFRLRCFPSRCVGILVGSQ